jgi:hypothetical protein
MSVYVITASEYTYVSLFEAAGNSGWYGNLSTARTAAAKKAEETGEMQYIWRFEQQEHVLPPQKQPFCLEFLKAETDNITIEANHDKR